MIEEKYLQMSISIRRTYLKLINNLDLYHNRALKVSSNLEETLAKLDTIQEKMDSKDKKPGGKETLDKILDILKSDILKSNRYFKICCLVRSFKILVRYFKI
jgi:hypothetical protein